MVGITWSEVICHFSFFLHVPPHRHNSISDTWIYVIFLFKMQFIWNILLGTLQIVPFTLRSVACGHHFVQFVRCFETELNTTCIETTNTSTGLYISVPAFFCMCVAIKNSIHHSYIALRMIVHGLSKKISFSKEPCQVLVTQPILAWWNNWCWLFRNHFGHELFYDVLNQIYHYDFHTRNNFQHHHNLE